MQQAQQAIALFEAPDERQQQRREIGPSSCVLTMAARMT